MFVARFSAILQRNIDLTNAFKIIFATTLLGNAVKSLDWLGNALGALRRARKDHKVWNLPRPLP